MTRRRRLRRRLLWAGVLFGLVLLLVVVSAMRFCVWGRDLLTHNASRTRRAFERKEGTMTRTRTLVVGIAVAALAIAPMALGKGRLAPYPPSQVATYRDAGERPGRPYSLDLGATAGRLGVATAIGHPPPYAPSPARHNTLASYRDAGERPAARASLLDLANATGRLQIHALGKGLASYRDAAERAVPISTHADKVVGTAGVDSGRDVDWQQIGIGFGLGVLLAIGLGLAVQAMRARPLAH
jgi:hypothetical protein